MGTQPRATWATAETWFDAPLAEPVEPADALAGLLRRYLAAYGPATVADVQRWAGLTRLAAVVDRAGPVELRHTDGPRGRERVLLDVPGAPLPDPGTVVPVRLLPDFDDVLLGHDDRTRIVPADVRPALASRNGMPPATVLVDGAVGGTWTLRRERLPRTAGSPAARRERAVLTVTPLRRWSRADLAAVRAEAERVVRFVADDAAEHAVAVTGPA